MDLQQKFSSLSEITFSYNLMQHRIKYLHAMQNSIEKNYGIWQSKFVTRTYQK